MRAIDFDAKATRLSVNGGDRIAQFRWECVFLDFTRMEPSKEWEFHLSTLCHWGSRLTVTDCGDIIASRHCSLQIGKGSTLLTKHREIRLPPCGGPRLRRA